jgi:hypothetical protein
VRSCKLALFEDGGLVNLCITIAVIKPKATQCSFLSIVFEPLSAQLGGHEKHIRSAARKGNGSGAIAEPGDDEVTRPPDLAWTPALQKNKWPLKVGTPAPTYTDS